MKAAARSLVGQSSQVSFGQLLDSLRVYGTLFPPGLLLLLPGGPIQCNGIKQCGLVVEEDVSLGSTNIRVYTGRAFGPIAQEKLPDEPPTAEGTQEAASGRPQRFSYH
ncbi:MAG: hypothetical protein HY670_09885 [Chloroflexi bacterium]|nr:hypothetical protein [Chloroflexota bacterium]